MAFGLRVVVLCSLGWTSAGIASAQLAGSREGGAPLTYVAPSTCPAREELVGEIERILSRAWSELPSDVGIAVQLEQVEGTFVLSVVLAEGERRLSDATCRPLVLAAALIVALAIDPDTAVRSATAPAPVIEPVIAPPALSRQAPGRELGSPYDTRSAPRGPALLGLGAGVMLDVGLLPEPSFGAAIEGIVRLDGLDLRLRGTYLFPSVAQRLDGIGAEVSALAIDVHVCARPIAEPALGVCGGLYAGALLGAATGPVTRPEPGRSPGAWVAVGAGLWLPWSPWDALDIELLHRRAPEPAPAPLRHRWARRGLHAVQRGRPLRALGALGSAAVRERACVG